MTDIKQNTADADQVVTIQATAKRLKGWIAISALMFWGGLVMLAAGGISTALPVPARMLGMGLGSFAFVAGAALYLITKLRIWWHHD